MGDTQTMEGRELGLEGRRFREPMRTALAAVADGLPVREAAAIAGLESHQDVARAAQRLGIGRRRMRLVPPIDEAA